MEGWFNLLADKMKSLPEAMDGLCLDNDLGVSNSLTEKKASATVTSSVRGKGGSCV